MFAGCLDSQAKRSGRLFTARKRKWFFFAGSRQREYPLREYPEPRVHALPPKRAMKKQRSRGGPARS